MRFDSKTLAQSWPSGHHSPYFAAADMYRPWLPRNDLLNGADRAGFPQLSWSVHGRSVLVHWKETFAPLQRFDIAFDDGLAGLVAIDESTYASTRGYGLPNPDEFDASGFAPLPWPAWKEEASPRAALIGDLGGLVYRTVDSYYLSGGNVVLLIDVADCAPRISAA